MDETEQYFPCPHCGSRRVVLSTTPDRYTSLLTSSPLPPLRFVIKCAVCDHESMGRTEEEAAHQFLLS